MQVNSHHLRHFPLYVTRLGSDVNRIHVFSFHLGTVIFHSPRVHFIPEPIGPSVAQENHPFLLLEFTLLNIWPGSADIFRESHPSLVICLHGSEFRVQINPQSQQIVIIPLYFISSLLLSCKCADASNVFLYDSSSDRQFVTFHNSDGSNLTRRAAFCDHD